MTTISLLNLSKATPCSISDKIDRVQQLMSDAEALLNEGCYESCCEKLLELISIVDTKSFQNTLVKQIQSIQDHVHGKGLSQFISDVAQHESGYIAPLIACKDSSGLRGMSALQDFDTGDVLFKIPLSQMLTCVKGEQTQFGKAVLEKEMEFKTNKRVIFLLLACLEPYKNDPHCILKSHSYVEQTMCHFWDKSTIDLLQGSHVQNSVIQLQEDLRFDYEQLSQIQGFKEVCSFEDFKKIKAELDSKNFVLKNKDHEVHAFVPIADTINHREDVNSKWTFNPQTQCYEEIALRPIVAGQSVWHTYGTTHANSHLLLQYGFTQAPCPFDYVEIENWVRIYRDPTLEIAQTYWDAFIKVFLGMADGDALKAELLLCEQIFLACQRKLAAYATTIEEDQQWLASHPDKNTEFFIRQLLLSEKMIVQDWGGMCKLILVSVQQPQEVRQEWIKQWSTIESGPGLYLKHTWSKHLPNA